ncbi:outer membrane protein [Bartonella tribocorum]|uniref:Porin n=1 Tax=Bartonella tribocorum TaxID=85701 RepID=A0A2M6UXF2_9HYPH|nr:outer membrane protein [Bartonella tribocorum]PIT70816.1 hemin-binding protein [Bartonella tribocorum]
MNTKRLITASIFSLISASTALAADVLVPHQPASSPSSAATIVAPTFSWTGLYLGIKAGGFSSKADMAVAGQEKSFPLDEEFSPKLSGFVGGFYAGSNIDLGDGFIFGVDTDLMVSWKKHTKTITIGAADNTTVENAVERSRRSEPTTSGSSGESANAVPAATQSNTNSGANSATTGKTVQGGTSSALAKAPSASSSNPGAGTSGSSQRLILGRSSETLATSVQSSPARSGSSNGTNGTQHGGYHSAHGGGHSNLHGTNYHGANPHGTQSTQSADKSDSSVYGIEQMKKMASELGLDQEDEVEALDHTFKQTWGGATRVRIGFAADRFMPYLAGGIAYGQFQDTISISVKDEDGGVVSSKNLSDETKTMIGYTIGGGVDFSVLDNVIVRAEYRYSDFGKKEFAKEKLEVNYKTNDFRVGVAYKF